MSQNDGSERRPVTRVRVDKQSIDFQLGQIIARIDAQNGRLDRMSSKISKLTFAIIGAILALLGAGIGMWGPLG